MGMPEKLDEFRLQQELYKMAFHASANSDWVSCYIAWSELQKRFPSEKNLVMVNETSRLIGMIDVTGIDPQLKHESIISILGEHSGPLLEKYYLANGISEFTQDVLYKHPGVEDAAAISLLENQHAQKSFLELETKEIEPIQKANADSITVFPSYMVSTNDFRQRSYNREFEHQFRISEAQIICVQNATFSSESELIRTKDGYFADAVTKSDALAHNTREDSLIVATDGKRVIVKREMPDRQPEEVEAAFWLAYPTTFAWGHFFNEVLLRCAVMSTHELFNSIPIIISAQVPESFEEFLHIIFPQCKIMRIPRGTSIQVNRAYVVPIRISRPSHEYWSLHGDLKRLHAEPEVSGLLRDLINKVNIPLDNQTPKKIFLSRSGALYRRGINNRLFTLLAEKHSYSITDLGAFSAIEQISMIKNASHFFGEIGSQWDLVATLARRPSRALIVHHDRPFEWEGLHWLLTNGVGEGLNLIVGKRGYESIGFGEKQTHLPISLNDSQIEQIEDWLTNQ